MDIYLNVYFKATDFFNQQDEYVGNQKKARPF